MSASRMLRAVCVAFVAGVALAAGHAANAAEIRLLSAGAVELGLVPTLEAFERESGHRVVVAYAAAPALAARFAAGPPWDLVIAPPTVLEALAASAAIGAERVPIGKVGIGVAVRPGVVAPDIGSADALRRALLDADSVVFNRASTGLYVDKLLVQLGVADAVNAKATRVDDGAAVMRRLLAGTRPREFGLGAMTEIVLFRDQGLRLVGPLPAGTQNTTRYIAAPAAQRATEPGRADAAEALLRHLAGSAARAAFTAVGIEPAD